MVADQDGFLHAISIERDMVEAPKKLEFPPPITAPPSAPPASTS